MVLVASPIYGFVLIPTWAKIFTERQALSQTEHYWGAHLAVAAIWYAHDILVSKSLTRHNPLVVCHTQISMGDTTTL